MTTPASILVCSVHIWWLLWQSQVGCCPCDIRWALLTPPHNPQHPWHCHLSPQHPSWNSATTLQCHTFIRTLENVLDPPRPQQLNNQGFPKAAGWMWATPKLACLSLLLRVRSLPEGQRTGERMSLHVNEAAFVKRPLCYHLFGKFCAFSVLYNNSSITGACMKAWAEECSCRPPQIILIHNPEWSYSFVHVTSCGS